MPVNPARRPYFEYLIDRAEHKLLDECPVWEDTFPDGSRANVCGVRDAAVIAAKLIEETEEAMY